MKVYIGKYKNYFGPHELARKLLFWKSRDDDAVSTLTDKIGKIRWVDPIFNFLNRKYDTRNIKVTLHDFDTWNMDVTLAYIIVPLLKQLKTTKNGAPHVADGDVPEALRSLNATKENEWDVDSNHFARWDYVLDEMIFAFESLISVKTWENSVETYSASYIQYYSRVQAGLELFGKYYTSLWD